MQIQFNRHAFVAKDTSHIIKLVEATQSAQSLHFGKLQQLVPYKNEG